jgi:hypothetical protein
LKYAAIKNKTLQQVDVSLKVRIQLSTVTPHIKKPFARKMVPLLILINGKV